MHFARLSFYRDKFYAYSVNFNTAQYGRIAAAVTARLGKPSREDQESLPSVNVMNGGFTTRVVNTKRWDVGDVVVLVSDRGAGELAGQLYAAYLPLARQATPPKPQTPAPPAKPPF